MSQQCLICGKPGAFPRRTRSWWYDWRTAQWTQFRPAATRFMCLLHTQQWDVIDTWAEMGQRPEQADLDSLERPDGQGRVYFNAGDGRWHLR